MGIINRKELIEFHNVILNKPETASPLTVGNGGFAFTFDITGMQTLYTEYLDQFPLCTMAEWGWHITPAENQMALYTHDDLIEDEYDFSDRKVHYPVTKKPGNEKVYDWLRENPHRYNLARIGLFYKRREIKSKELSNIRQELALYDGLCNSHFTLDNKQCDVTTFVHSESDTLCLKIESELLMNGLTPCILFPYPSWRIHGSDWSSSAQERHKLETLSKDKNTLVMKRVIDNTELFVRIHIKGGECACNVKDKCIKIIPDADQLEIVITFARTINSRPCDLETSISETKKYWNAFWEKGGIIRLRNSKDKRGVELERRIILSMYLLAAQCTGNMPPQETGLSVNSWYGKFHLEMHLWHQAFLPLWNRGHLLKKSLNWYKNHLANAVMNAAKNGFKGARWPKMVDERGIDSPSPIAPLLVWQQPHIIYMLELCYRENPSDAFLHEYEEIVTKTAKFMTDYPVQNKMDNRYHLMPPLIPAQECHAPETTKDPAFELEYFVSGLTIAAEWYKRLKKDIPKKWINVMKNMALSPVHDGKYQAHANINDTFVSAAVDHPSMLCAFGFIDSGRIDKERMLSTLTSVISSWDYESLWGWDFAVMAMTAARLGLNDMALDLLLYDTPKNRYVKSGNNAQGERKDLPLYLPGNGSLLLAIALLAAGVEGKQNGVTGFPHDGTWCVEHEGIRPLP
ncbi:MAG: glycoside hydrolase family 65 [Deltaproteobacteria bacterium]|nr:glycoside hydrolase family 65 [Deltaproteobacteria bacterium]